MFTVSIVCLYTLRGIFYLLCAFVQDKAGIQGQKLARLAREWEEFDSHFQETKAYIRRLKQMVPTAVSYTNMAFPER